MMFQFLRALLLVVVLLQQTAVLAQSPAPVPASEPKAKSLPEPTAAEKAEMERLKNSAWLLFEEKKYAEAEQQFRALLVLRQRTLGAEHPETLTSRSNVARMQDYQGRHAEAEQELRAVLKLRERLLGAADVHVFTSCLLLARCLQHQKKLPEALKLAQRAEDGYRHVFGDYGWPLGNDGPAIGANERATISAVALREGIEAELKKLPVKP